MHIIPRLDPIYLPIRQFCGSISVIFLADSRLSVTTKAYYSRALYHLNAPRFLGKSHYFVPSLCTMHNDAEVNDKKEEDRVSEIYIIALREKIDKNF